MDEQPQGELAQPAPTQDEQTLAFLARFLPAFGSFVAPLTIYLLKRQSRFVSFHALQALFWQMIYVGTYVVACAAFFIIAFSSISRPNGSQGPPAMFLVFPFVWLLIMTGWVLTLVIGIVYGIRAMRGEWAAYPGIGRWARRIVGE